MSIGHYTFEASHISTVDPFPIMANKIHVLLVEHDNKDHDITMNMLQCFPYKVTSVKLASTALSILSEKKVQFDLVLANMNSPDSFGFQLLQVALKMDMLVILMSNDNDDALTTTRALEQGAFLCIRKPVPMQILACLWQFVLREKLHRLKEDEPCTKIVQYNSQTKEFGEDVSEGSGNNYNNVEKKHKSKKKLNSGNSEHSNDLFERKVWTEWTLELHGKFMDAARQLGQGRCYPKDILELMNVPGLTRMQVASHLQKCRSAKWLPPNKRKFKQVNAKTTPRENFPPRSKTVLFGSMPFEDNNSQFLQRIQEHHETNHQGFTIDPPTKTSMLGHNGGEIPNNGYDHPQRLIGHGIYPFAQDNETFNMGQLAQTFGMDEPFVYDCHSVTSMTNISSNHVAEDDAFELTIADPLMVQNSDFQQELGMDYNGSWQSLVLNQEDHNKIPTVTNATSQWIQDVLKLVDNAETEDQMREG